MGLKRGNSVLPPLPSLKAPRRDGIKIAKKKRAALRLKQEHVGAVEPRKFRDPARVAAVQVEREKWAEEQGLEKAALDKKIAENEARVKAMREDQDEKEKVSGSLSLDEQVLILQSHFDHGIGVKIIAKQLGRNHSVVSRFLAKYRSTASLAKMHLQNNAERLARRIVQEADVDQSLEVLDRMDVLPRKERGKSTEGGNSFQVIVGMPSGAPTMPVRIAPTQKAIEAALIEPSDGN